MGCEGSAVQICPSRPSKSTIYRITPPASACRKYARMDTPEVHFHPLCGSPAHLLRLGPFVTALPQPGRAHAQVLRACAGVPTLRRALLRRLRHPAPFSTLRDPLRGIAWLDQVGVVRPCREASYLPHFCLYRLWGSVLCPIPGTEWRFAFALHDPPGSSLVVGDGLFELFAGSRTVLPGRWFVVPGFSGAITALAVFCPGQFSSGFDSSHTAAAADRFLFVRPAHPSDPESLLAQGLPLDVLRVGDRVPELSVPAGQRGSVALGGKPARPIPAQGRSDQQPGAVRYISL